jgi:hypothetical protein
VKGDFHAGICGSRGLQCPRPPDLSVLLLAGPFSRVPQFGFELDPVRRVKMPGRGSAVGAKQVQ